MANIPAFTTLADGDVLPAAFLNTSFSTVRTYFNTYAVQKDVAGTISVTHTFSAAQTFSAGLTVSANGITVTGNSTITGTLGGLTGLTVASGGATITGNSTVTGTLNVTSSLTQGGTAVVLGSGTSTRIPRLTAASTIANGSITDDGTVVTNATQPRFRAAASASGAIGNGTTHTFSFSTIPLNIGTLWAIGNPTRITAAVAGGYLICATIAFSNNTSTGASAFTGTVNHSAGSTTGNSVTIATNGEQHSIEIPLMVVMDLAAAEYVTISLTNNSGSNLAGGASCILSVVKVW